jgi:AraC family ethanolamine operon transcriptional activator
MSNYSEHIENKKIQDVANVGLNNPKWRMLEAADADEQAHNLKDWQQQYDQISHGEFYGRISEISLKHVHAFREYTSQSVRQQCNVWPDSIWLGFSADNKTCRINGHNVGNQTLMVRPGNTEFELVSPEQFNIYGIVANQSALMEVAEKQDIASNLSLLNSPMRDWSPQKLDQLKKLLNQFIKPTHAESVGKLEEDILLMAMLDILQQDDTERREPPSLAKRQAVVAKVKEHLLSHPNKQITITELCELAHVSRRTLQYSFEDVLGISPLRYLRISRLNSVRRTLLSDIRDDETILRIAERWGFWHAGQFAHDYTQLFGENPSQTRLRTRFSSSQ